MRRGLGLSTVAAFLLTLQSAAAQGALCPPPPPRGGAKVVDDCNDVFRVECPARSRVLTGFRARVDGGAGIVTALHGVVGCPELAAFNLRDSYRDLRIAKVDVALDAAFLTSANVARAGEGLPTVGDFRGEQLRVVGYPQGLRHQFSHRIEPQLQPLRRLFELLPDLELNELRRRGSPDSQEIVMSLSGAIQNGYSGAPILTWEGRVVGIANGGLRSGMVDIGWAMPVWNLRWEDARDHERELTALAEGQPSALFGAEAGPVSRLPVYYLTDGGDPIGKIYRVREGRLRKIYQRSSGRIYSVAVAPNGTIYFSNHNDNHIYRLKDGEEVKVYTHSTYTRNVEFDAEGRLHFSEASGAGRDGAIYRLDRGRAKRVFTVRLSDVDGFWAGNFALAPDGSLWLSSGNRRPASLYKVEGGKPRRMFTSGDSISGLSFTPDGDLLYADWRQRVYRVELPGFIASEATHARELKWASDVAVAATRADRRGGASGPSERQTADTGDWVQILSVAPAPGAPLRYRRPVDFTLEIRYRLVSARKARLVVSVGQLPASARGCERSGGSLVDAGETLITQSKGTATVKVRWSGGKGSKQKSSEGHLAFYPSIWKTREHDRIAYFGKTSGFCYGFSP